MERREAQAREARERAANAANEEKERHRAGSMLATTLGDARGVLSCPDAGSLRRISHLYSCML
jgi:hypothetical protein